MATVFDVGRELRASLEGLPYPVYRRALERILFEEVGRMYGEEMSREQRALWDRTVAAARSGVIVPTPFDLDGIAPERIDPVLARLIADWEDCTYDARRGLHGALGVMQVYAKELAGVYRRTRQRTSSGTPSSATRTRHFLSSPGGASSNSPGRPISLQTALPVTNYASA